MTYLTADEFEKLGFECVSDFEALEKRASLTIDLYTRNFYNFIDFDNDYDYRKNAVKKAMAFQIAYLDSSGIETADDKIVANRVSIGRTTLTFDGNSTATSRFNLSQDAINLLESVGFGLVVGVDYDR